MKQAPQRFSTALDLAWRAGPSTGRPTSVDISRDSLLAVCGGTARTTHPRPDRDKGRSPISGADSSWRTRGRSRSQSRVSFCTEWVKEAQLDGEEVLMIPGGIVGLILIIILLIIIF